MRSFDDSLRGYGFEIHQRDHFTCRFCGADGTKSFATWLTLSCDHLLPKGHPDRENPDFIVTACSFCNTADNRYFDLAEERGLTFDGKTPTELVAQRLPYVQKTRQKYQDFWETYVQIQTPATRKSEPGDTRT
jgi:Fe-S oxidoreductase